MSKTAMRLSDMRYNGGGGDFTGIQVITSYLFGEEPVHLNDLYYRPKDTTNSTGH